MIKKWARGFKEVQYVQRTFKRFKGSRVQNPENNLIYKKPNFYRELGCELSGDAAREDADRAIEPKHAAKVRQR
jgi:hypothetical protein